MAVAARLWRLGELQTRADASIKGCHAAIVNVRGYRDAHGPQISSYIHNVSSSLGDLGQLVGAVARQEAPVTKASERIAQDMADIRRVTDPPEQLTTL